MKKILILLIVVGGFIFVATSLKAASHDKDWQESQNRTPNASIEDETVELQNVRNWNHSQDKTISKEWIDSVTINPEDIQKVWFGFSSFSDISLIGHTFLSFELEDGTAYVLSIEARREQDEEYSALKGLFNQYELLYGWGTERDYIGVRTHLLQQEVEMYPLILDKEEARAVFIAVSQETAEVALKARFYNTLTSNCTNELTSSINKKYPDSVSYHIAHNFPGLSVNYLQKQGLLVEQERVIIPNDNPELLETIQTTPEAFSDTLREILEEDS